ncbi:MAG: hypothetical protein CM1200mP32_09040 [Methanobacteriota archaeon]|nr:MAG: hypothetical protein CM1200mP32_09040 [Euryarchaeota archaeon]
MVHSVESILGYLHEWYEPLPGDLVWTGTPEGVGAMNKGDFGRVLDEELRGRDS